MSEALQIVLRQENQNTKLSRPQLTLEPGPLNPVRSSILEESLVELHVAGAEPKRVLRLAGL